MEKTKPEFTFRLNGNSEKEVRLKIEETTENLDQLKKDVARKFHYKSSAHSRLFTPKGIELLDDDFVFIKENPVYYFAPRGEDFDNTHIIEQYKITRILGEGGYGKVYHAVHREQKKEYAIKYTSIAKANMIDEICRESKTLKMLRHKNIVQLYEAFIYKGQYILIMDFASGGELRELIEKHGPLPETQARHYMEQICSAIAYCHKKGIIHRDLKLENLLFFDKSREQIQVVDFGIAGFCKGNSKEKTDAGTQRYMAPELISGKQTLANPAMDVWALGVILYLMLRGKFPNRESLGTLDVPISLELESLLKSMLCRDYEHRISLYGVQTHEWFSLSADAIKQSQEARARREEQRKLKEEARLNRRKTLKYEEEKKGVLRDFPLPLAPGVGSRKGRAVAKHQTPLYNPARRGRTPALIGSAKKASREEFRGKKLLDYSASPEKVREQLDMPREEKKRSFVRGAPR